MEQSSFKVHVSVCAQALEYFREPQRVVVSKHSESRVAFDRGKRSIGGSTRSVKTLRTFVLRDTLGSKRVRGFEKEEKRVSRGHHLCE